MNIQQIAKLANVTVDQAEDFINYDWPDRDEHVAWITTASDEEIAAWIASCTAHGELDSIQGQPDA